MIRRRFSAASAVALLTAAAASDKKQKLVSCYFLAENARTHMVGFVFYRIMINFLLNVDFDYFTRTSSDNRLPVNLFLFSFLLLGRKMTSSNEHTLSVLLLPTSLGGR